MMIVHKTHELFLTSSNLIKLDNLYDRIYNHLGLQQDTKVLDNSSSSKFGDASSSFKYIKK